MIQKNNINYIKNLDHLVVDAILLLKQEPKTDLEIVAAIPGFKLDMLGKLVDDGVIEHYGHLVYLSSLGDSIAASLSRLMKFL